MVVNETIHSIKTEGCPGQRTPQELKRALDMSQTYYHNDELWPYLLKSYYYALFFMYVPTYTETANTVNLGFREAVKVSYIKNGGFHFFLNFYFFSYKLMSNVE
jgi:hypothetical protein